MDKGILVDTYYCSKDKKDTVIKGFSYSCSNIFEIVDRSLEIKDFSCAEALEEIYEDSNYIYYLSCLKSDYIEVRYENETKEKLQEALKNSHINIKDLDKFEIDYIKYEKEKTK